MSEDKKLWIKNNVTGEYEGVVPIKPWTPNESMEKDATASEDLSRQIPTLHYELQGNISVEVTNGDETETHIFPDCYAQLIVHATIEKPEEEANDTDNTEN